MTNQSLFQPYELGSVTLANRIVMAPLTRNRAGAGLVPGELAATYYAQRATAGLLITEATQISAEAQGYQDTRGSTRRPRLRAAVKSQTRFMTEADGYLCSYGTQVEFHMSIYSQRVQHQARRQLSVLKPKPS